jgi:diguanylate cyclase (GGDEF)-like protein/PAS domain S-box-containing protein
MNGQRVIKILLVDDNLRALKSLHDLLSLNGFKADTAVGGASALRQLEEMDIDIMLLDLKMPDVNGFDVMSHIFDKNMNTVVIVVSGESAFTDISKAMRLGAYDYLRKPYEAIELITTLNNAVKRVSMEDERALMQARLDQSERLHRFVVNSSPDIIFMLDEKGRIRFSNSRTEELIGLKNDDLIGINITDIIEEGAEQVDEFVGKTGTSLGEHEMFEVIFKSSGGRKKIRHFEITLCTVDDCEDGNLLGDASFRTSCTARDVSGRVEAEAFINFQAYHDLLTRLPNRSLFKDRLDNSIVQAERNNEKLAVMFIDLNRFKVINDSLGHAMGDRLLQSVSNRLLNSIRKSDTLSRFGGDEFTLLLPKLEDVSAAEQVAEKILVALKDPFSLDGHDIHVGASIGIAMYPESAKTMDGLIKNADIAMYCVKNSSRDGFQFFRSEMSRSTTRRSVLEQDMRKAIQSEEFEICYQPQVTSDKQGLYGVEALIRWNHPVFGRLFPSDFIGIAEESRLIIEMDLQTLRTACREIHRLHSTRIPELRLSVNLSPIVFGQSEIVDDIIDILSGEGFPPRLLELEITESLLMDDRSDVYENLCRLTDYGVSLAIDDFGTGYSSLSYLQKFPVSSLKIDRSFVLNIKDGAEDASLVKSIISMAQGLKLSVIAEGVENKIQLEYLRSLGCAVVQGYLFSAATSLKEVMQRVNSELYFRYDDTDPSAAEWTDVSLS